MKPQLQTLLVLLLLSSALLASCQFCDDCEPEDPRYCCRVVRELRFERIVRVCNIPSGRRVASCIAVDEDYEGKDPSKPLVTSDVTEEEEEDGVHPPEGGRRGRENVISVLCDFRPRNRGDFEAALISNRASLGGRAANCTYLLDGCPGTIVTTGILVNRRIVDDDDDEQ